ncbi:glycosyltransferase, partial [Parabacteroides distasonis]
TTDVLLQVSKLEGWGCTVNEALMYGNRVIVSDSVGSRALLRNKVDCGQIFESGNWDVLKNCIEYEISKGSRTFEQREQISNDFRCIYPEAEAEYFLQILDF